MKMNLPKISKRLEAAASFARQGARIADVGTDHAYLPIYLLLTDRITGAVASDINIGPVERARENIYSFGAENKISLLLTDGLFGIEEYAPDDIFILGMGGELIVDIVSSAKWLKNPNLRLVLQPMTHPEAVREYLSQNGFSIIDELLVKEEKIYQIICAEYSGEKENLDACELMLGKINIQKNTELLGELLERTKSVFLERVRGKEKANVDASEEKRIINGIEKLQGGF